MMLFNRFKSAMTAFAEPAKPSAPVMEEIATTGNGRDITRGYVDGLPLLPAADPLQQSRVDSLRLYDSVRSDDQVQTAFQQRQLALCGKEWTVTPGGKRAVDKKAADFIEDVLKNNLGFDRLTEKMLSGLFWGYAVAECVWTTDGSLIVPSDIKVRQQRRFGFAPDGRLKLLTSGNPNGEFLPERKFWTYCCGGDSDDDPYGLGMAHWLYWPVFFKKNGLKMWLLFLDKFSMPTSVGKYPAGALQSEKDRLLEALAAIRSESGVRIPDTMTIELLEAAKTGISGYTELYDRMNAAISKVILGHTGSTDSTSGRLGGESNASEVRDDLIAADADLICSSFNRSVVKWLVEWNFSGAALPTVWRDVDPGEDLKLRAERDKLIFDMGYRPAQAYIEETYNIEVEAVAAEAAPTDAANPSSPTGVGANSFARTDTGSAFAEPPAADVDNTPVTAQADLLAGNAQGTVTDWIGVIRAKLDAASDLNAFQEDLLASYGDLDSLEMTKVMALAFAAADLAGRFDVREEAK